MTLEEARVRIAAEIYFLSYCGPRRWSRSASADTIWQITVLERDFVVCQAFELVQNESFTPPWRQGCDSLQNAPQLTAVQDNHFRRRTSVGKRVRIGVRKINFSAQGGITHMIESEISRRHRKVGGHVGEVALFSLIHQLEEGQPNKILGRRPVSHQPLDEPIQPRLFGDVEASDVDRARGHQGLEAPGFIRRR